MTRDLVIHIGMPKCGSTYIQRVMLQNQVDLAAAGVAYPHDEASRHPGNGDGFHAVDTAKLDQMFGDCSRLIVSFEGLLRRGSSAGALAKATKDLNLNVEIVVLLRPFSSHLFGDYSQMMKQHFDRYLKARSPYDGRSFEDIVAARAKQMQPAQDIQNWKNTLPDAELILASHGNIRPQFERYFGGAQMNWSVPLSGVNRSIRMQDCDLLSDMIRDASIAEDTIIAERARAFKRAGEPDDGKTESRIAMVEKMFESHNAALLAQFGFDNRLH